MICKYSLSDKILEIEIINKGELEEEDGQI